MAQLLAWLSDLIKDKINPGQVSELLSSSCGIQALSRFISTKFMRMYHHSITQSRSFLSFGKQTEPMFIARAPSPETSSMILCYSDKPVTLKDKVTVEDLKMIRALSPGTPSNGVDSATPAPTFSAYCNDTLMQGAIEIPPYLDSLHPGVLPASRHFVLHRDLSKEHARPLGFSSLLSRSSDNPEMLSLPLFPR